MKTLDFEIFEIIAADKGCDVAFPVKEKMLIEVIKQFVTRFSSENGKLIFGGGTSLVCAYNELTKRFSEDADFRFVPCPKSTKSVRNELTQIAQSLDGFELVCEPISDSRKIEFHFKDNQNFVQKHSSLRPYIKLEVFFTDNLFYTPETKSLTSFYNKITGEGAETEVACVSLKDTSIDKISSFLWRIYSNKTKNSQYNPADMRHLHDLTFLTKQFNIDDTFREHFLDVFNCDMKFRLKEDISLDEIIKDVLTILRTDKKYEIDFVRYVSNMSYAKTSEQLTYDKALDSFFKLMKDIKKA